MKTLVHTYTLHLLEERKQEGKDFENICLSTMSVKHLYTGILGVTMCSSGCIPHQKPCNNRSDYVFWDEVHPTEAWNLVNAISVYNSTIGPAFNYPMDIKQLVESEIKRELEFTNESPSQPSATE